jgi:hypothetical protein
VIEFLAHAGHDHGAAPGSVALLVALAALAVVLAASALVRKIRS